MEIVITVNGKSTILQSDRCNCQSLIGRKYTPTDNSYSSCLSVPSYENRSKRDYYLAGNQCGKHPQICTIVSEPFQMKISNYHGFYKVTMILIECPQGLIHCYMYDPRGLH